MLIRDIDKKLDERLVLKVRQIPMAERDLRYIWMIHQIYNT
ncbi:MAG: hypothetical protein ACYDAP_05020 [Thermoplasmataceae archaeon]